MILTNLFLAALLAVEGAHGHDMNRFQITPAFVREVNRIHPRGERFCLDDRRDPVRARRMVLTWLSDLRRRHPSYSIARLGACYTAGERGARLGRGLNHGARVAALYQEKRESFS